MIFSMKRRFYTIVSALLLSLGWGFAQENTYQSVLADHTWYRLSVTQEGVHKLDYSTLQSIGIDMAALNPNQIRLFGNPSGSLPEKNSEARPDDLTEMAIYVEGAEDGVFDAGDVVLFYGQEPTRWVMVDANGYTYNREQNAYSDTTYYYLCVDSGTDGLRIGEKASLPVEGATAVISDFPDFFWHDVDLYSPYSAGRNWLGERLTNGDSLLSVPFSFPNLVTSKTVRVKGQVLGHFRSGFLKYSARMNDNLLVNNISLKLPGKNDYGKWATFDKQGILGTDEASIDFSMVTNVLP